MKLSQFVATLALSAAIALPAQAGVDVGVSVQISQPGVYGRVDIGRYPQPLLMAPQPVWIARPVQAAPMQPVYMWVPPGHQKHWGKHCARYGACGVPVHFVQERWYHQHVMGPEQGRGHRHGKGEGKGHGKGHDKRD